MPEQLDLDLPSGRLHAERRGVADAPLALCVHGLSANLRAFDAVGPALEAAGWQVVALDLRGRGGSPDTGPGTYGLRAHARDVLDAADALGAQRFALIGWSMGALITLAVALAARERLSHAVLIDAAGSIDDAAVAAVRAGLARLDAVVPSPDAYVEAIRDAGTVEPWEPFWDAYYAYELEERDDGTWSPRTSKTAALEDLDGGIGDDHRPRWAALTMPSLLVRCTVPLGGGLLVPEIERDGIQGSALELQVVEVERNHYGVMTAPELVDAVTARLGQATASVPGASAQPET